MKRKKRKNSSSSSSTKVFIRSSEDWPMDSSEEYFRARVVRVHKKYSYVAPEQKNGEIQTQDLWLATIARKYLEAERRERNLVAVGDRVLCKLAQQEKLSHPGAYPSCTVEARSPRVSNLSRIDPTGSHRDHIIATNVSQVVIVVSFLLPQVKWHLIDRYLVVAEQQDIKATIIFNKEDLLRQCDDPSFIKECEGFMELYKSLGYRVLSWQANQEIDETRKKRLVEVFNGEVSVLSGQSGVGKSSIVNHLEPESLQQVEDEQIQMKGRHTTSHASLLKIGIGGYIIDTPGIRNFAINREESSLTAWAFVEMRPYMNQCQYRSCTHREEPDCAIKKAVEDGKIHPHRYRSYKSILSEDDVG